MTQVGFYDGIVAALAALKLHCEPTSVEYCEVLQNCDEEEVIKAARKSGNMRWSGLDKYMRYQKERKRL